MPRAVLAAVGLLVLLCLAHMSLASPPSKGGKYPTGYVPLWRSSPARAPPPAQQQQQQPRQGASPGTPPLAVLAGLWLRKLSPLLLSALPMLAPPPSLPYLHAAAANAATMYTTTTTLVAASEDVAGVTAGDRLMGKVEPIDRLGPEAEGIFKVSNLPSLDSSPSTHPPTLFPCSALALPRRTTSSIRPCGCTTG